MNDWYMKEISKNIASLCKDDMSKEAFLEACPKHLIKFMLSDDEKLFGDNNQISKFDDGSLVLMVRTLRFCSNIEYCASDIDKIL